MDHLSRLRKAFNPKPLDFKFGPDDPHYAELEKFRVEQLQLLHDMPSLIERPKDAPSDTYLHSLRVADDVYAFALYIGLPEYMASNLRWAVSLHDIGKLDVPMEILDKPGKLTDEEFKEMQRHTKYGAERIRSVAIKHPMVKLARGIAKYHHERDDGKGYFGVTGKNIPYRVRLVQLCDIYDAVSAPRAYRTDKEQLTPYETMKNILDPHGFLYGSVDQRFAIPFCLLKVNLMEGDLSREHHKMLEHYLLDPEPFSDDDFWPSPANIQTVD
jgi:HD-GYP domain-containing protein (c-di-GMP phosphodiesterase class II)